MARNCANETSWWGGVAGVDGGAVALVAATRLQAEPWR